MENQRANTGKKQRCLNGKWHTIVIADQNGHQNGSTKHGEHMLQT